MKTSSYREIGRYDSFDSTLIHFTLKMDTLISLIFHNRSRMNYVGLSSALIRFAFEGIGCLLSNVDIW